MIHELKSDPVAMFSEKKTFEIRFDDRNYQVGDKLVLRETVHTGAEMKDGAPLEYTGRTAEMDVRYIMRGPVYGLAEGWVIMS